MPTSAPATHATHLRIAGTEADPVSAEVPVNHRRHPRPWSARKWNEAVLLLSIPVVAVLAFFCCPLMFALPNAIMSASWFLQILADFNGRR